MKFHETSEIICGIENHETSHPYWGDFRLWVEFLARNVEKMCQTFEYLVFFITFCGFTVFLFFWFFYDKHTVMVRKFQLKRSMKLQLKLNRNLAKFSMKFHMKFHGNFDKHETSLVLH